MLEAGRPRIGGLVDAWERDRRQFEPWDEGTRKKMLIKMHRIRRELGERAINQTDRVFLEDWHNSFCTRVDVFNKRRYALIAAQHEQDDSGQQESAQATRFGRFSRRSTQVPASLQVAMEQSLVMLQAQQEICDMRHADYRGGYLLAIRDKVSGDTEMASITIRLTPELEEIRRRSLKLDDTASPYLIHRKPQKEGREWPEGRRH
jgi:hypothetical protein